MRGEIIGNFKTSPAPSLSLSPPPTPSRPVLSCPVPQHHLGLPCGRGVCAGMAVGASPVGWGGGEYILTGALNTPRVPRDTCWSRARRRRVGAVTVH